MGWERDFESLEIAPFGDLDPSSVTWRYGQLGGIYAARGCVRDVVGSILRMMYWRMAIQMSKILDMTPSIGPMLFHSNLFGF